MNEKIYGINEYDYGTDDNFYIDENGYCVYANEYDIRKNKTERNCIKYCDECAHKKPTIPENNNAKPESKIIVEKFNNLGSRHMLMDLSYFKEMLIVFIYILIIILLIILISKSLTMKYKQKDK